MNLDEIVAALGHGAITFVEPGSPRPVPARWREIADAPSPAARAELALSLWNSDFAALVPNFFASLQRGLADVLVCDLRGEWVLLYLTRDPELLWVGRDPATFGETPPPFWASFPPQLRTFLTEVHAGFTDHEYEYGPVKPEHMVTYAEWAGYEGPIPDWDVGERISSTRLTFVAKDSGSLLYCVSPDAPPGKIVLLYEGDIDPTDDFGPRLDILMSHQFERE